MIRRTKYWYREKLEQYFKQRFGRHVKAIVWCKSPAPNKWMFDIPPLKLRVILTSDDRGRVSEFLNPMPYDI